MITPCSKEFTITVNPPTVPYYAYYKLDEATLSTALIDQVSGFTLGASAWHMVNTPGKIGGSLDMGNGTNTTFQNGPDAHWIFSDSFTIRFWIKTSATGGNYFMFGTGDQWNVTFIGGSDTLEFLVSTTMGDAFVDTPVLTNGVWHEVFFWWEEGVGCGCRVDNGADVTSANTDPIDTSFIVDTLYLQNSHFMNPGFAIDEIAIWDHKLTDAEMTIDWNGGAGTTFTH